MENQSSNDANNPARSRRRKVTPRACVAERNQHARIVVTEALEDLGFITYECAQPGELATMLEVDRSDLVVLGLSAGSRVAREMLNTLAAKNFTGKVLLLGPSDLRVVADVRNLGAAQGITMLPGLAAPFDRDGLRIVVAALLPAHIAPKPSVDVVEALRAGWLELWYQPKIETRTLAMQEAEALIRVRHPSHGIISPSDFMPRDVDSLPHSVSEFVITQAVQDWRHFFSQRLPLLPAINLPITFLQKPEAVETLCRQMPEHPGFDGMIVEIDGTEVIRHLDFARQIAKQLRFAKIAISIDDLGLEWRSLAGLDDFPFVEIKVDQKFISGCAHDRFKQATCRQILDLADGYGARTVAEGVETSADFVWVRKMGFNLAQGFLFAKPMTAPRLAETKRRRFSALPIMGEATEPEFRPWRDWCARRGAVNKESARLGRPDKKTS